MVHDPLQMRVCEGPRDVPHEPGRFRVGERPAGTDALPERFAFHQSHHEEDELIGVVHRDDGHDVRM